MGGEIMADTRSFNTNYAQLFCTREDALNRDVMHDWGFRYGEFSILDTASLMYQTIVVHREYYTTTYYY